MRKAAVRVLFSITVLGLAAAAITLPAPDPPAVGPTSPPEATARAASELIPRSRCETDAGYPDCLALELRGLEQWLGAHQGSPLQAETIQRMAILHLELADRFEQDKPWQSEIHAELLRGRALELAGLILELHSGEVQADWARRFIRELWESGKPFSFVPRSVRFQASP